MTLADLSAAVSSPQADQPLNCVDPIMVRVTLTNRGGTGVAVSGLVDSSSVQAGDCSVGPDFTFRLSRIVFANTTSVIFDQPLYSGPHACCLGSTHCAGSCLFRETFQVVTEAGRVPAGSFEYRTYFQNCPACPGAASVARACSVSVAPRQ